MLSGGAMEGDSEVPVRSWLARMFSIILAILAWYSTNVATLAWVSMMDLISEELLLTDEEDEDWEDLEDFFALREVRRASSKTSSQLARVQISLTLLQ